MSASIKPATSGTLHPTATSCSTAARTGRSSTSGHRVELGEIDLAAAKVPGVEDCCALYDQAHEQIWLFYTGEGVTKRDIAVALRADLPGFMVPRKIEQLEAMPRLDNGKTNMRALAERITAAAKH